MNQIITNEEEISRQAALVEVVVGEVEHFESSERAEPTRQDVQTVHSVTRWIDFFIL